MGITIGYEISLPSEEKVEQVLKSISDFVSARGIAVKNVGIDDWRVNHTFQVIKGFEPEESLENHKGEWPTDVKGLALFVHPAQEKMFIVFGRYQSSWYGFGLVKTQFAPVEAHKEVIEVLDELKRLGVRLVVRDDSGYYETRDQRKLEKAKGFLERLARSSSPNSR